MFDTLETFKFDRGAPCESSADEPLLRRTNLYKLVSVISFDDSEIPVFCLKCTVVSCAQHSKTSKQLFYYKLWFESGNGNIMNVHVFGEKLIFDIDKQTWQISI